MAQIIRTNIHGNFRCINKQQPPIPKKRVVESHPQIEPTVEIHDTPVEEEAFVEPDVENDKPKAEGWKARREKKTKRAS